MGSNCSTLCSNPDVKDPSKEDVDNVVGQDVKAYDVGRGNQTNHAHSGYNSAAPDNSGGQNGFGGGGYDNGYG